MSSRVFGGGSEKNHSVAACFATPGRQQHCHVPQQFSRAQPTQQPTPLVTQ